ncbi:uncharacterized protein LOC118445651 [Vespa mandarinia]|uniref:uncharacterized protein LOC118445651 n=1 Tax=Vespa mandarinia TaxID=7446 RepID=UPI001607D93A|nr:uncharacterized protein LOC118445651 [Vespa mandarinia]
MRSPEQRSGRTLKSQLKGYQAPSICFKDENDKLGLSNAENCEILAKHFDQLLNCPEPKHKLDFSETTENLEEDIPPNAEEIKETINNLKNNKASGEDSITAELLKWSQSKIIEELQLIFEDILRTERFPEEWKVALIHPLHEKGDKLNVDNYRGISLLQTAYKIISKILLNRIETTLDKQLGKYQAGFRKGRSCSEQIFNLISIIRQRILNSKDIGVTFIDFKKAFDSVDRETIDKTIREFGVKNKLANLILLDNLKSATTQINLLEEIANKAGLKISVEKTKFITNIKNAPKFLTTDIGLVEKVKKFKYLGEIIQENGLEKSAVEEKLPKMEIAYGITKNFYNKRLDKLEVLERRIMRKILGPVKTTKVWKLISNNEIYRNIEGITETTRKRRLQFFGHIYRMDESRLTKRILMYLWEKKATTSWIQEVKKDLERNNRNISEEETIDREIFRKRVLRMEGFQGRLKKKPGAKWSEDRKKQHSEKMKEYRRERKRKQLSVKK